VAKDPVAVPELRWRGLPPTPKPILNQLVGTRLMRPHGDRRDGTQSRRVERQEVAPIEWENDVMRVFVLRDDLQHPEGRSVPPRPRQDIGEGAERSHLSGHLFDGGGADTGGSCDGHCSHGGFYVARAELVSVAFLRMSATGEVGELTERCGAAA
jgi:hypothetical protein